ncbi:MAG: hypothetical protein KDC90_19420 [Ignavibacteriae bacterium]|nr:hypothetical protein [Ignavibacteriota bacterium]
MNDEYSTENFYEAAYLVYEKNRLVNAKLIGKNTLFTFDNSEIVKQAVDKFYSMQTAIDALNYGSAIRSVKSMIHALRANTTSKSRINNNANHKQRGTEAV